MSFVRVREASAGEWYLVFVPTRDGPENVPCTLPTLGGAINPGRQLLHQSPEVLHKQPAGTDERGSGTKPSHSWETWDSPDSCLQLRNSPGAKLSFDSMAEESPGLLLHLLPFIQVQACNMTWKLRSSLGFPDFCLPQENFCMCNCILATFFGRHRYEYIRGTGSHITQLLEGKLSQIGTEVLKCVGGKRCRGTF